MAEKLEKFWISKYALSKGIIEVNAEISENSDQIIKCYIEGYHMTFFGENKEWHRTWEEAFEMAEKRRDKRIASLKKQLKTLEQLKF